MLGQIRCSLTQTLLDLRHLFGRLRPVMPQACLPPYHETELPAMHCMHTEHCLQFEKYDDVPDLLEEPDTELPSRPSSWEHEGTSWPSTSTLPVSTLSPRRYLLGRRTQPLGRREQILRTIYNERPPCTRKHTIPRRGHFLLPSIARTLLRTRDKAVDVTCWSITRLPSYILPEDLVIKWT